MKLLVRALLMAAVPLSLAAAQEGGEPGLAEETHKGLALRARHGVEAPTGPPMVHVHSISAHHLSYEFSTIATRDRRGIWTVSQVGEEGSALLNIETQLIAETRRVLTSPDARRLDRLLANPELYRPVPTQLPDVGVGAPFFTMEIVTPGRRTVVRWMGRLRGPAGQVADLVIGRG